MMLSKLFFLCSVQLEKLENPSSKKSQELSELSEFSSNFNETRKHNITSVYHRCLLPIYYLTFLLVIVLFICVLLKSLLKAIRMLKSKNTRNI